MATEQQNGSSSNNGNVISLVAARQLRTAEQEEYAYRAKILSMSKLELLDEMVRFQQERSDLGHLTVPMMIRGKYLFRSLEQIAETKELQILTRAYRRHLEQELETLRREKNAADTL